MSYLPPPVELTMTRPEAMECARRMWANGDGGWTLAQIRDYLAARGQSVTRTTVRCWADPEYAEARNASLRESKRRCDRARRGSRTRLVLDAEAFMDRARELRAARVTYSCIARVIALDYGVPITEHEVYHALKEGRPPRRFRKRSNRRAVPSGPADHPISTAGGAA